METRDIMNAADAARFLSISKRMLYKLTCANRIPFYKPCGRRIFFRRSELDAWMDAGRVPTYDELVNKNA